MGEISTRQDESVKAQSSQRQNTSGINKRISYKYGILKKEDICLSLTYSREAVEDLKAGKIILVTDDEDRRE